MNKNIQQNNNIDIREAKQINDEADSLERIKQNKVFLPKDEYTVKELLQVIKEEKNPDWTIKLAPTGVLILRKNGKFMEQLAIGDSNLANRLIPSIRTMPYIIAREMDVLPTNQDFLSNTTYDVYFDYDVNRWFATKENKLGCIKNLASAEKITNFLNESEVVLEWIEKSIKGEPNESNIKM